jgi:hypothetical protein
MKIALILGTVYMGLSLWKTEAQVVRDPLLDYYQQIGKPSFYRENDDSNFRYSPQTHIFCFEADFTRGGRRSFFITDSGQNLNAHGKYGWAIYAPVEAGGYQMVTDESTLIDAGLNGPVYVGYIDQIKGYGLIIGEKYSVTAYYLSDGTIQSKEIDQEREHANPEHYPKYFKDTPVDHHVTTYTLAQLAQKYANPNPKNVITPASN